MGSGSYIFCEWDACKRTFPEFKQKLVNMENMMIAKCNAEWAPKGCGFLTPAAGEYGRTSILPGLFDPNPLAYGGAQFGGAQVAGFLLPPRYWRQYFNTLGNQVLIQGGHPGETLPEDWKVGWIGLAFPNKQMNITEIRWQIGDHKYGRQNIEELKAYNKPAIIFEEPMLIDEEQAFHLYGYVDEAGVYQRIVMLGAAYFKIIDKALTAPGAAL